MAVCPVCGCKTEDLDFVQRTLQKKDCRICSFCDRQLKAFDSGSEPSGSQLKWLDAVISKDVSERDGELLGILKSIRGEYPETQAQQNVGTQQKNTVFQNSEPGKKEVQSFDDFGDANQIIKDLQKRIAALDTEIRFMKRKQMIKTAVELGVPVVLFLLLIIIFVSSGLLENLKTIFEMAGYVL